ncbi:nifR3 family TIM-barrel protein [Rhizobium aquaticum]|uniref:tRNA-dihydrouridine synthase n=1 Tax=Rhizobium aquaticum TaxID=1549636 RepID=A0ABV2IVV4_9HYPH
MILGPMSGVTDLPFRKLAWRYGAGLTVTEMVASGELVRDMRESRQRLKGTGARPHMVQLAGREARWMAEAARIAEGEGADIIDINMGCPAKKVIGGYSGSALMRDPDLALSLVEATVAAISVPVTVKMRLGWDETSMNAPEIAKRCEDAGVKMITVHGRTRMQFYEGKADWDAIRAVREAISLPLVANGDVATAADAEEILRRSGADAVMVGRASQGQPWLCGRIAGACEIPAISEIADIAEENYRDMLSFYGVEGGLRHARKHVGWYLDRHAKGMDPSMRASIMTSHDPEMVVKGLREALLAAETTSTELGEAA